MQSFKTTVQLPDELNEAIIKAVNDSFEKAKSKFDQSEQYPKYLNKKQACHYLNVSYNTLNKFKADEDFPCSVVGGVVRYNRDELDKYMLSKK